MRFLSLAFSTAVIVSAVSATAQVRPHVVQNVDVYNREGRFAGWPANNGIWNWGNEIVVGFTLGFHKEKTGHTIDPERPPNDAVRSI